jgi:hypothetical protein
VDTDAVPSHWIDIVVDDEDGATRLIVECKHWRQTVQQSVISETASRRDQLGASEAAVITTADFTSGARNVAADEQVRLLRVKRLRAGDSWQGVLREIRLRGTMAFPELTDLRWRSVDPHEVEAAGAAGADMRWGEDEQEIFDSAVEDAQGSPAETVRELLSRSPSPAVEGLHSHTVALPEPRYLRVDSQRRILVRALEWTERVTVMTFERTVGPRSEGMLLIERLDPSGESAAKRVLMLHELYVWDIDPDGNLVLRQ